MSKAYGIIEKLIYYAEHSPGHPALVSKTQSISYRQLLFVIDRLADDYIKNGLTKDSVIGIKCEDDIQNLLHCLAAIKLGATSLTIPSFEPKEAQDNLINQSKASYIAGKEAKNIAQFELESIESNWVDDEPIPPSFADSPARLLFSTSGTTGKPKLVEFEDIDIVAQAHRHIQSPSERFSCMTSVEHNFAKRHRLFGLAMGATNVFPEKDFTSLVEQSLALKINVLHLSAFQARELLALPDRALLSGMRLKLGGSLVSKELRKQLITEVTETVEAGYGTTETGAISFTEPKETLLSEHVGKPLPGLQVSVRDAEGRNLSTGHKGELWVAGNGIFRGYFKQPELTQNRLLEGQYKTGDVAFLDEQNRIHICGRIDDMFTFNSLNIYPQELETLICEYPDVSESLVMPKTSDIHGNIPIALVVPRAGSKLDLKKLETFVRKKAGIRSPRYYCVVTNIPRASSGKLARGVATELHSGIEELRTAIASALKDLRHMKINPKWIDDFETGEQDLRIGKLNLDSLATMELLVALETQFDISLTVDKLHKLRTLGAVAAFVSSAKKTPQSPEKTIDKKAFPSSFAESRQQASVQNSSNPVLPTCGVTALLKRVLMSSRTVVEFRLALKTLESRITPLEVNSLASCFQSGYFFIEGKENKFYNEINSWLESICKAIDSSGKSQPEPFETKRLAPSVRLYHTNTPKKDKTLLLAFAMKGASTLSIPNAVLLQHTDSTKYDVVVIGEPQGTSFYRGVPLLGNSPRTLVEELKPLCQIDIYKGIRTIGTSAGGFMAIVAGLHLNAEKTMSISSRFNRIRSFPMRYLRRMFHLINAAFGNKKTQVIYSYAQDNVRDKHFAKTGCLITGGKCKEMTFADKKIHLILKHITAHSKLGEYLDESIFE